MKKWISLLLACVLLFGLSGQALAKPKEDKWHGHGKPHKKVESKFNYNGRIHLIIEFKDIHEAKWAAKYIAKMKAKKIFYGFEDGTFRPNQPVTRVEAIATAVRLMGQEDEAMSEPKDVKLHFKDAHLIDKHYLWAKGYIMVALENGLFDASEDKIQPNKPATRAWVASLLVRALGLEDEALKKMTEIPNFKDAKAIPAGAVGYVNVAVEKGLISGYPDGTFRPNKPITRAEMAVLLDLAEDGFMDKEGAVRVAGTVESIQFTDKSVTDDVYKSTNGKITVKTFLGDTQTFNISSKLAVQYGDKFIQADQLAENDTVFLVVLKGTVIEALLLDEEDVPDVNKEILRFSAEIEAEDGDVELNYENKGTEVTAKVERDGKEDIKGDEAIEYMEELFEEMALKPDMDRDEVIDRLLEALDLEKDEIEKINVTVAFSNGKTVVAKEDDLDEDEDDNASDNDSEVRELELKAETKDNEELTWNYKLEKGKEKASIVRESEDSTEVMTGEEAVEISQDWLDEMDLSPDMTDKEAMKKALAAVDLDQDDLRKFELEVEFSGGKEIKVDWEDDDDDEDDE